MTMPATTPDPLADLRAGLAAVAAAVESLAEGHDISDRKVDALRASLDAMRHTVDDPANPANLRDTQTRQGARLDAHDRDLDALRARPPGAAPVPWRERALAALLDFYRLLPRSVRIAVWALAFLAAFGWYGAARYYSPEAREERAAVRAQAERDADRAFRLDSLRLVKVEAETARARAQSRANAADIDTLGAQLDSLAQTP